MSRLIELPLERQACSTDPDLILVEITRQQRLDCLNRFCLR